MSEHELPDPTRATDLPAGPPATSPAPDAPATPSWAIPAGTAPTDPTLVDQPSVDRAPTGSAPVIPEGFGPPGPKVPPSPAPSPEVLTAGSFPAPPGTSTVRRPRALLAAAGVGAAVVLAGAGFLASGGLHHSGGDTTLISNASQGVPDDGAPGGEGRTGRQGAGGYGDGDRAGQGGMPDTARFTAGRITAISGSTLTLDGMRGDTVKVTTTSATKVTGDGGGTSGLSSLKVGQLVMVIGTRQSDGSYQAAVISTRLGHDRDGDEGRSDGSRRSPQDPSNQGGQNQGGQNQGSQNQSGSDQGA